MSRTERASRRAEWMARAWPPVLSVVLYSVAFPPLDLGLVILVALVPWLNQLREATPRQAWRSGILFGALFWLYQMVWIMPFVGRWASFEWALLPWLLCPVVGCWYFAVTGWLLQRCFASGSLWLIPLIWAGIEAIRSYVPLLAYPWGLAATPLWIVPQLIQSAAFGTIFLVSAWVVLVNVIVANLLVKSDRRPTLTLGSIALAVMALSLGRYFQPTTGEKRRIAIGQPGVDMAFLTPDEQQRRLAKVVPELADEALLAGAALLILPEGLAPGGDGLPPNTPFGGQPPLPTVLGGQRGSSPAYQSAFGFDGERWTYTDKIRLVIFGEYVPARDYFPFLEDFRLPSGDFVPGDRHRALDVGGLKVGPMICFEAMFPNIAQAQADNGAQLLVTLSNDDWFMGTGAPEQLRIGSIFRAAESGLPLARSGSQGRTTAIDARGRIVAEAPYRERRLLVVDLEVPPRSDTLAYRWVFPWIAGLSTLIPLFRRGTSRSTEASPKPRRPSA